MENAIEKAPEIHPYVHRAQYYETDRMGIIHHSNYIRWMEEARVDFMEQSGFSYQRMEELGIGSPVLSVNCQYKSMVHFSEDVRIEVFVTEYTGTRLGIRYRMTNLATGAVCTVGSSQHCFLSKEGKVVSLRRSNPEIHALFLQYLEIGKIQAAQGKF